MGIIEKLIVSDETMRQLEAAAERHGRTLSEEVARRIEVAPEGRLSREDSIARMRALADSLHPLPEVGRPLAALVGLLASMAIGCTHANAGQLRSVDEYKFRDLAAGCWTATTNGAEPTIGWLKVCIGEGKLTVRNRGGHGPLEGSFTIEADRMVIDAPIAGDQPAVTLTCDAVVRPYSGLALRDCQVGSTSYPDVEFSYDSDDVASVLLGCWERVDDDIFPEDICFDPVHGFETSVYLPDAREGFGSPGKYTLDSNRLGLHTEHPYEGWLWRDESSNFSCELEFTDVRHMTLDNCGAGVKTTRFSRKTGP